MKVYLIILILLPIILSKPMDLILLDDEEYPEAKCLDGTKPGFYY